MNIMRLAGKWNAISRLKKALLIIVAVLLFGGWYLFFFEPTYSGPIDGSGETGVFAHRGFGDHAPDNSLVAAKAAMEEGLAGVDVDGQLTKDGELVVFHDLSVDRLTGAEGRVSEFTLAELEQLNLGTKFEGEGYEEAYVASFEDFVREITPEGILMVELKVPGVGATGIEDEAARIIERYDAHDRVFLSSFNPIVLHRLEKIDSRINTVFIFMDTNWNDELRAEIKEGDLVDLPWFLRQEPIRRAIRKVIDPDMLSVNVGVDEDTQRRLLDKGWPVFLWTPNDEAAISEALDKEPYGVISDRPLLSRQLRDAAGH